MTFSDALASPSLSFDDAEFRRFIDGVNRGRPGVVEPGDMLVSAQGSPNNTVSVAGGNMFIDATTPGATGQYHVSNDAAVTSPTFTATTTNGRKDRLIYRVGTGLQIVQGTPSGSPAEPAITGNDYLELALITFPSSTTNITAGMITDRRVFTGGGFPVLCTSGARPTPYLGMHIYETDTGRILACTNTTGPVWTRGPWFLSAGRSEFHASRSTNQSVASSVLAAVVLTAGSNPDSWSTPDGGLSWAVPSGLGGLYQVGGKIEWSGVQLTTRAFVQLRWGASAVSKARFDMVNEDEAAFASPGLIPLAAGDTIKVECFQATGSSQNVSLCELNAYRVGA